MKYNTRMAAVIGNLSAIGDDIARTELVPSLRGLLGGGIVRERGAVFLEDLRRLQGSTFSFPSTSVPDLTGAECSINHIHVSEHVSAAPLRTRLLQAFKLASVVPALLPPGRYRFIVAFDPGEEVTWRFHRVRKGEEWVEDDLETYEREGVAVIDADGTGAIIE